MPMRKPQKQQNKQKIKFIKNRHVNYGFAYSISLAKKFVGSDNFILCLGDTIYSSNNSSNCCKQLIDFYNKTLVLFILSISENYLFHR